MAKELWSYIVDPGDGKIKVAHVFYGRTEAEAAEYRLHHIESCEYFAAAVREGRELRKIETVDVTDLPVADDEDDEEGIAD